MDTEYYDDEPEFEAPCQICGETNTETELLLNECKCFNCGTKQFA